MDGDLFGICVRKVGCLKTSMSGQVQLSNLDSLVSVDLISLQRQQETTTFPRAMYSVR